MNDLDRYRRDEARRLICWIRENKSSWMDIRDALTEQNLSVASELQDVIKSFRENGFYQFLVLLLYTNNERIESAIEDALLLSADRYWDDKLMDMIIDLLLDRLAGQK